MIHDDAAHADQAFVTDAAAVQNDFMPDSDIGADRQWRAGRLVAGAMADMQHAEILHIGTGTDTDMVDVAADHNAGPDRGVIAEHDVADDSRRGMDIDVLPQAGNDATKGMQGKRQRHDK